MALRTAIGLMSGTSMDGIDLALIRSDGEAAIETGPHASLPYEPAERSLLREALAESVSIADRSRRPGKVGEAERMITARHAELVRAFLAREGIDPRSVDVIGFHGQTVLHRPEQHLTIQIGDGEALAAATGIPVVFDMRAADVAAGGQGAPLVPAYHQALALAAAIELPVVVVNLGGVGNVTFISKGREPLAFDTGPANALIDDLMIARIGLAMDEGGRTALAGIVDEAALTVLLADPFFDRPPPKSLDRNAFSRSAVDHFSTPDAAATLVAFTAATVARAERWFPEAPRRWIVCGGGARNPAILAALADRVRGSVTTADAVGWSSGLMEAQAFAYLALRSLRGLPLTFPSTTGVGTSVTGGRLARPNDAAAA